MSGFIHMTKVAVGQPTQKDLFADPTVDDLEYLFSNQQAVAAANIPNGSFEIGSLPDVAPAGWTLALAAGNSTAFETAAAKVDHGAQSFSMTTPGSITGGASLTSQALIPVGGNDELLFMWRMLSSAAGILNTVQVSWYDHAQSFISTSTLYTSTANSTSWVQLGQRVAAPSNARFFALILTGVNNAVAGTVYWDGVSYSLAPAIGFEVKTASGNWTCPAGVFVIELEGKAGDGGGGPAGGFGQNPNVGGGGGGSGGWFKVKVAVNPGQVYPFVIGAGGPGGNPAPSQTPGSAGSVTSFNGVTLANAGAGGDSASNGGSGGAGGSGTVSGGAGAAHSAGTGGVAGKPFIKWNGYAEAGSGGTYTGGSVPGNAGSPGIMFISYGN